MYTPSQTPTVQFSRTTVSAFYKLWGQGKFEHLRLGQAFCNHMNTHMVTSPANKWFFDKLYEADGDTAKNLIHLITDPNQ